MASTVLLILVLFILGLFYGMCGRWRNIYIIYLSFPSIIRTIIVIVIMKS